MLSHRLKHAMIIWAGLLLLAALPLGTKVALVNMLKNLPHAEWTAEVLIFAAVTSLGTFLMLLHRSTYGSEPIANLGFATLSMQVVNACVGGISVLGYGLVAAEAPVSFGLGFAITCAGFAVGVSLAAELTAILAAYIEALNAQAAAKSGPTP